MVATATGDPFLDNLITSRDQLQAELASVMTQRAGRTAKGVLPPYHHIGEDQNFSENEYISGMIRSIKELDALIQAKGGESGSFGDQTIYGYVR